MWDETTLAMGQAIARGEVTCTIGIPNDLQEVAHDPEIIGTWFRNLCQDFPVLHLVLADQELFEEGVKRDKELGERFIAHGKKMLQGIGQPATRETLHQALDAYARWIETTFLTPPEEGKEQRTSQSGKKQAERARSIKEHCPDRPLSELGVNQIDQIIHYWCHRPMSKKGKPFSAVTCRHHIRLFKHFLKWLHKNPDFPWKKPVDLEFDRVKILEHPHEIAKRITPNQVPTYTREELAVLWEYATPLQKVFLCLALNCGFNISEIATLRLDEINDGFIKRLRPKSKVYGEWKLWEITKQAIAWAIKRRGKANSPQLLVTEKGHSYLEPTRSNNRGAKIPNSWNALLTRIQVDKPFKRLSFGKLRKTAGNLIRKFSDGEIAGIFLCHGHAVKTDELADVYTNRPFQKVFEAQDRIWEYLKEIFTGDFPEQIKVVGAKISLGKIRQIRSLARQGFKTSKIAEVCGVAEQTVRRWCNKNGKGNKTL